MSKAELLIFWITVAILIALMLYPPWVFHLPTPGGALLTQDAGMSFLLRPPTKEFMSIMIPASIAWDRLAPALVVVTILALAALFTLRFRSKEQ